MNKNLKLVFCLILILIVVKVLLSAFVPAPSQFSDEYIYSKLARSFFNEQTLAVHGQADDIYPPLYPIVLSPTYVFSDMQQVYFFMKVLNAILSSLIVIPAFLLAREFLSENKALLASILVAVIPATFSFTPFIMSDNLFYPLFLFSVYFIYKSFVDKNYKWDILAGVFIGLSYLTKVLGIVLLLAVMFVLFIKLFKKEQFLLDIKKKIVLLSAFFIVVGPYLLRNFFLFGNVLGLHSRELGTLRTLESIKLILSWSALYLGFLILASGIIFFIFYLYFVKNSLKNNNLAIFSLISMSLIFFVILLAANHNAIGAVHYETLIPWLTKKPLGRYIDVLLPLIFIGGLIGYKYYKKNNFVKYLLPVSAVLMFSAQLVFFPLFPASNMSLTWMGALKYGFEYFWYGKTSFDTIYSLPTFFFFIGLFLVVIAAIFILHKKNKLKLKLLAPALIIFFLMLSLLNVAVISYNSNKYWYSEDQMQLGIWFNEYDKENHSRVLFDERDCVRKIPKINQSGICENSKRYTILGFWMNDDIRVDGIENLNNFDYVISKHNLDLELLKSTDNGIFLYITERRKSI